MYEDKIEWFEYYSSVILNENNFLLDFIYLFDQILDSQSLFLPMNQRIKKN